MIWDVVSSNVVLLWSDGTDEGEQLHHFGLSWSGADELKGFSWCGQHASWPLPFRVTDPDLAGGTKYSVWPENNVGTLRIRLGVSLFPPWTCYPFDLIMDGWKTTQCQTFMGFWIFLTFTHDFNMSACSIKSHWFLISFDNRLADLL